MAITINPATKLISVDQSELSFVSGTLYTLDSDQFRKDVNDLLSSEAYIWMDEAYTHNTEVTVAGTTFARTIEFINGYSIQFEDTGASYTIRIEGSNNNIFDVENGVMVPTALTTVVPTNSAGLLNNTSDLAVQVWSTSIGSTGYDSSQLLQIMAGALAGLLSGASTTEITIRNIEDTGDLIVATVDSDGNRSAVAITPPST